VILVEISDVFQFERAHGGQGEDGSKEASGKPNGGLLTVKVSVAFHRISSKVESNRFDNIGPFTERNSG